MAPPPTQRGIRREGHLVEALLRFLKEATAHSRWVLASLLLLYAASGLRMVQTQESALIRRLGRLEPRVHGPGLLICWPPPIDEVLRFDTAKDHSIPVDAWRLVGGKIGDPDIPRALTPSELRPDPLSSASSPAQYPQYPHETLDPVLHGYTLTLDHNLVQGRFSQRYRLDLLTRQAISRQLAQRPIDASLTEARQDLARQAAADIQAAADRLHLGVRITGLDVLELSPPAQVMAAFEDVVNARQFAKTMEENSRQYHGETVARAEGEAIAILHRAAAYRAETLAQARGEAAAFLALLGIYRATPELVSRRLLRESLDQVNGQIYSRSLIPTGTTQPALLLEPAPEFAR